MRKVLVHIFAHVAFIGTLALWQLHDANAASSQSELQQIHRAEDYLNARKSFSARFMQTADNGQVVTGTLLVKRPGRMNLSYDPPMKDSIIADGSFVYMWDGELEQSTTLPLGGSLADLILRDNLRLSGDIEVTDMVHEPSKLEITVRQKKDPDQGTLTLLFEDQPFIFHGWRVVDAQNRTTTISLQNMQDNVTLAAQSFVFVPPKLGKNTRSDKPLNAN